MSENRDAANCYKSIDHVMTFKYGANIRRDRRLKEVVQAQTTKIIVMSGYAYNLEKQVHEEQEYIKLV